ncbi:MAG: response regulator, partial [Sedimentisphaerales bacterium]|nr:response regulator [Sedimentisphaerales bacterium]
MMERKVLIVDDELSVLKALERALRKEGYGLLTAESGEHALDLLSGYKVAVILSDINMPGMNGIEFLSRAQHLSPDSIKMVLSGYADIDLVMDAINHGHVWRYLTKPWQPEDVRVAIDNAMGLYDVRAERESLLTALEIKNQQLVKWSNKLEDMVDRRTEHIQNELMLMTCLMEGCDLESFCGQV